MSLSLHDPQTSDREAAEPPDLSALVAGLGVVLLFVAFALGSLTRAVAPAKEKATDETDGLEPATA